MQLQGMIFNVFLMAVVHSHHLHVQLRLQPQHHESESVKAYDNASSSDDEFDISVSKEDLKLFELINTDVY